MFQLIEDAPRDEPWNKGKLIGQKKSLKLKEIWTIRIRPQMAERHRDLALFNLAIDSKLRGCDLTKLRVSDVTHGGRAMARAMVMQQKTQQPVQFEITDEARESTATWIKAKNLRSGDYLFRVGFTSHRTFPHGSICGSYTGGLRVRARTSHLRHPLDAPNESVVDLPSHEESTRCPATAWPYQARKHDSISRSRG